MMYTTPNDLSREKFEQVVELLKTRSKNQYEIAREVGTSQATVSKIARGIHFYQLGRKERKLPVRKKKSRLRDDDVRNPIGSRPQHLPSPEEIALACERIRSFWTHEEMESWEPPTVSLSGVELV